MRELVRCSCNVMSKRYNKKVEVPSAPPLQIADYINSINTKQENFELKLEQGRVNFQHILETLEDNELDKILEVLKPCKGTSENKIAFVLRNNSWRKRPSFPMRNVKAPWMKQVKEHRRGLRQIQMMADGGFSVARSSGSSGCNVMWNITWLLICKSRLKGCYIKIPSTPNTVNCEHETLRTVNRKQGNLFFTCSNFKSETVSRAGQIVLHWRWLYTCPTSFSEKSSRPVWADCKALWAHDVNQPWCFFSRHADGDRTIPYTSQATHLCGIADGSGGLAVLVCACWTLVVLSLFLGCCLLLVLVYIFIVGWFILRFLCWVFWLVSLFIWFRDLFVEDFG